MELSGNYLKGYEGRCYRCQKTERAYYYFADYKHRKEMEDNVFMHKRANCPACVTNAFFSSPHSMEWKRTLTYDEVRNDLKTLVKGIDIDFMAAEEQAKEQQKLDIEIENDNKRSEEILEWAKKKA